MTTLSPIRHPAPVGSGARGAWILPAVLVALSAVPVTAGTMRLVELAGGPRTMPVDPRYDALPLALVVHLAGAGVYALVGILQLMPRFRRRHLGWHRRAGRALVVAGLVVAVSALWITLCYGQTPGTGDLLFGLRLVVGSAMAGCLVLGFAAVRRRDIPAHRAWMVRAYALGLGAGTQAFTEGFGGALFGDSVLAVDLQKSSAWVINLLVAEWAIRRGAPRPVRAPRADRVPS